MKEKNPFGHQEVPKQKFIAQIQVNWKQLQSSLVDIAAIFQRQTLADNSREWPKMYLN